ncbi:MAG: deoxyribodipyrimidine photo-lyase [Cyclobacteriaceae bacterium]|nr:deoxyribodipyrimidine photo-lyase [Cyclobacteriaceae bacterium]
MAHKAGAKFLSFKDHVIFEAPEVLKQDGTPFKVFTPFKRAWLSKLNESGQEVETVTPDFQNFVKADPAAFPTLAEMGFEAFSGDIPSQKPSAAIIGNYDKTRDFPAQNGTTKLGIHLRFGTVSIREMVALARKMNDTWLNELIWREFYSYIMQHFPHVTDRAFNKKYDKIPWLNSESDFDKWCNGLTGYPIVDAGMRELNATGYMHNRVRMITASFLTKHLLIDWRWGESYFASKLLDYELASNNGGWQWAAGTGTDAQPWFRIFNPYAQAEKFDPNNEYIKKWVPEYDSPSYPKPMVDHKKARERALATFKSVLA